MLLNSFCALWLQSVLKMVAEAAAEGAAFFEAGQPIFAALAAKDHLYICREGSIREIQVSVAAIASEGSSSEA